LNYPSPIIAMTTPSAFLESAGEGSAGPSMNTEVRTLSSLPDIYKYSEAIEPSSADEALELNSTRSLPLLSSATGDAASDCSHRRNPSTRSLSPTRLHYQLLEMMQQQQDAPVHHNPIAAEQPSPCTGLRHGTDLIYLEIQDDTRNDNNRKEDNNNNINNNMDSPSCSTCQQDEGEIGSTINVSTIQTSTEVSASSSIAARWFALETTAEDRLSWHIITNEIKELAIELFHFLKARNWKKKLLTVAVIGVSIAVFYDLFRDEDSIIKLWIDNFIMWMTSHPAAAEFVFVAIYAICTQLFIPPTLLLLGAGWAFTMVWEGSMGYGIWAAIVPCFIGSILGALASFLRARYMMRDLIELFARRYPIVRAADQALQRDGFRILLLLRLCPLIPYHALNYLGGISKVSLRTFNFSLIGMLPYQVLIIVMGASAGSLAYAQQLENEQDSQEEFRDYENNLQTTEQQEMLLLIVTSMGVATLIIAMILAFRFTKKELQKVRRSMSLFRAWCVV
jgi:uncharacterized membrane protein YdjX (TVP38/TMEM64 family)